MKFFITAFAAAVLAAAPASAAVVVGNPANPAGTVDTCRSCTFVINQGFGVPGLVVTNYNFYAVQAGPITPLLFTRADSGNNAPFTVSAVGQQNTALVGVNAFAFNVLSGSNLTTANTYFGFAYTINGIVGFNYDNPAGSGLGTFVAPEAFNFGLGQSFTANFSGQPANAYEALNARSYSISAIAVPEPATWAMMLAGFGMIGFGLRSRGKQSVRVTYA